MTQNLGIGAAASVPFALVGTEALAGTGASLAVRAAYVGAQTAGAGAISHAISSGLQGEVPKVEDMNKAAAVSAVMGFGVKAAGDAVAASLSKSEGMVTQPYGELAPGLSGADAQANHLNQNAVYGSIIPKDQGASLPMPGNAITDVWSSHYDFHASLEDFWNQFRQGGTREEEVPTNSEYLQATQKALKDGGVPSQTAKQATQEAAAQQRQYGLQPEDPVPKVPGRLNQVKAPPTPVPDGKN